MAAATARAWGPRTRSAAVCGTAHHMLCLCAPVHPSRHTWWRDDGCCCLALLQPHGRSIGPVGQGVHVAPDAVHVPAGPLRQRVRDVGVSRQALANSALHRVYGRCAAGGAGARAAAFNPNRQSALLVRTLGITPHCSRPSQAYAGASPPTHTHKITHHTTPLSKYPAIHTSSCL